ncbi:LLM class flavin-dependent oxidoreductase [Rhodococcoides kyotonense]|uniref:Luciferase-like monooxygenase n=1 Tax=Rhodococcoides kyotonense TaxID=398843 RepID=A0A239GD80_9NOCA|nr:LLM class flavin-dependent oxidoreductase [Rhodococcus kyotonensis]SNS67276.1 Luciferase-like monooxygenase [Rhodococcus kyotonensis]
MPDKIFLTALDLQGTGVHPQAWRRADSRAEELFTAAYWTEHLAEADRGGFDVAFLADSFELQPESGTELGILDAASIAARAAAPTRSIGLIPTVTVTHTEPFHISKQIASIDFASHGRAGWEVAVSQGDTQAAAFGRKKAQTPESLWREADEAVEVVTRLWDSWEDDAEIRDVSTGRFIDRDKLHYIEFHGENFSVKGPSITPRSPQGQSIVVVRADSEFSGAVAASRADVIRIAATDLDDAAAVAARVRRSLVAANRDPAEVYVVLDLEVLVSESAEQDLAQLDSWAPHEAQSASYIGDAAGLVQLLEEISSSGAVDGVTLRPLAVASAVPVLAREVLPKLSWAGSRREGLLRDRLGLARPVDRYAPEGAQQ